MKIISRLLSSHAIRICDGRAEVIKGKLEGRLVRDVASLCSQVGVRQCELWVDGSGRVTFSREVPNEHYQKFRNIFSINR
jgi:hypothetical protein